MLKPTCKDKRKIRKFLESRKKNSILSITSTQRPLEKNRKTTDKISKNVMENMILNNSKNGKRVWSPRVASC